MKTSKFAQFCCLLIVFSLLGCSNAYKLEKAAPIQYSRAYYQHWTAPIKVGSSGINFHIANLTPANNVVIDSVFFRNLKGKLVPSRGKYVSQLVKRKPISEGHELNTMKEFPFEITNRECVVSYRENGETKYFKISNLIENEGIYYKDGPIVMQ
ncbi:hypothetical protein [Psychroserpens luteolus]|uniref:hypothetical protein n=1 Tax=Psychroserpens luteolus TaxID=2855840 RepID=UPI001E2FE9BA|nr:hypothetical protein [Psychroserpens luteolus]MCD2258199.1 hypothetical protein [Psychroserpens luteolus]